MSKVYLLGDAILDNFYWLKDPARDLKKEVSDLGYEVHNYAIDGMKVNDMINGIIPSETYKSTRKYPYQITENDKLYVLRELSKKVNINKPFTCIYNKSNDPIKTFNNLDLAVISVGGNDIGDNFMNILKGGVDYFITEEFIRNYEKIIETVKTNCPRALLVSVYLPFLGPGSSYGMYGGFASPIMGKWNEFIFKLGKKHNIPILDLKRTFDVGDRSHYGTIDTRASNLSNKCIADCISYINKNYNGYNIYYAPNCNISKITKD